MSDDVLRLHPSDWFPTIFDASDVERFLTEWVTPRLGRDPALADADVSGPPEDWFEVLEPRDVYELVDMIAVCKQRCGDDGTIFEQLVDDMDPDDDLDEPDLDQVDWDEPDRAPNDGYW